MTRTVQTPETQEVIQFRHIHIDNFSLAYMRTQHPMGKLRVLGTTFGYDSKGVRHYSHKNFQSASEDIDAQVFGQWCQNKGKTPEEGFMALQAARSQIKQDYASGAIDDLYLMAAFEAAIARVLEITGAVDMEGLG